MLRKLLMTAIAFVISTVSVFAQTGTLTGTVTDSTTNETLPGANIVLVEITRGAATDVNGNYTISNIPAGTYTVRTTFLGYATHEQKITISSGNNTLDVKLKPDTFGLDEIVVTGVISGTPKKKLAFTVSDVSSKELEEAPAGDASKALQGKVAGVKVVQNTGAPGSAAYIRLRGSTAIGTSDGGNQQPLIIVDGVILDGTLADIPTQNIKSMEILKGASAASIYGSRAANGVIQIFTKRGADLPEGKTSVTIRNEVGRSWLGKEVPLNKHHNFARTADEISALGLDPNDYEMDPTNSYMVSKSGKIRQVKEDGISDNNYGVLHDQLREVYNPGTTMTNYVSVARNMGNSNLALSFSNYDDSGVIKLNDGYSRQNVRVNLDQNITEGLDISASGTYSTSTNDVVTQGPGSPFWGALFMPPNFNMKEKNEEDGSPYNVNVNPYSEEDNPLYPLNEIKRNRDRNRFLGNVHARYRPIQPVLIEGSYSVDRTNQVYERWTPKGLLASDGFNTTVDQGSLNRSTYDNVSQNINLTAGYDNRFGDVNFRFKASYLYEATNYKSFGATGNDFAISNVPSWDAILSSGNKTLDNYKSEVRSENVFGIVSLDYKDRYIADFLIRRDGSSLFGADQRYSTYFRVSGAYRLTEDIDLPGISEWKLRASYGTAGLRPPFVAQYLTYSLSGGNPSKNTLGNPDIKPALAKELELGTDIEFLNMFSFSGSYSTTTVEDQILRVPLPASAGGFDAQYQNAGTLQTYTIEASLDAQAIQNKDMNLSFRLNFDRTRQKVTELDVAPFFQGPDYQNAKVFYVAEGETYGVVYGNKWLRNMSNLTQTQKDAAAAAGETVEEYYSVNNEGYVVTGAGTPDEKPVQMTDADGNTVFKIGDVNPDFNVGLSTNFNYKGWGVYFLLDAKVGGDIYNQTRAWLFRDGLHGDVDQSGKPASEKKPENYYRTFYNANNTSDYFVEDGSYLKLREASVSYQFGNKQLGSLGKIFQSIRISAIGRNLLTFTNYSGFDPEVAGIDNDATNFAFDGYSYPNFKTISGSLELRF